MIVGALFIALIAAFIWSVNYGRKLVRTERTDAVFGNPIRALGGWHWVIAGVSTIMILWFYFSWDAARSFFPVAGNELCQVAKLDRTVNPIRSAYPIQNRLLLGTQLLQRDYVQIDLLSKQLAKTNFNDQDRAELEAIISELRATLAAQADPTLLDTSIEARFKDIAGRIDQLATDMRSEGYPGSVDAAEREKALAQPGWGRSNTELPPLPMTDQNNLLRNATTP